MSNIDEKEAFSVRLKQLLSNCGWPSNSPTFLAREFNIRYHANPISIQTASNWLSGSSIPSQDKLQVLAIWLDTSAQWLRFGEQSTLQNADKHISHAKIQLDLTDLPTKIAKLSAHQKYLISTLVDEFLNESH